MTVPEHWTDGRRRRPLDAAGLDRPASALSAGTAAGWNDDEEPGHGVFVGLLRANDLPSRMPQHEECDDASDPRRPTSTSR